MNYKKLKTVAKDVVTKGSFLDKTILSTMKRISDIVGATLGPGGRPVLIEREDYDLPPFVTKDGVTVFRSLGFNDPAEHAIMEVARDASGRTAEEAGDGTTTATVLAESIVRLTYDYCKKNPKVSPQRVVRLLNEAYSNTIVPLVEAKKVKVDFGSENSAKLLKSVAKVSANGDSALAEAVLKCYDLVGDQGNVTIVEETGDFGYKVEKIQGYPILMGYEESCGKFYSKFINDSASQKCVMEDCYFLLYHGVINEPQNLLPILHKVGEMWEMKVEGAKHNVVILANGYSEQTIGFLAVNFANPQTLNVFPLTLPKNAQMNSPLLTLEDVAAITGASIIDPLNSPLDRAEILDLGGGNINFESQKWRSTIFGYVDEDRVIERSEDLKVLLTTAESSLDKVMYEERLARVSGGIAKLTVVGASNGELKERRDRADDAVCAVRGAIKHGVLPGGGWLLFALSELFRNSQDPVLKEVLAPALFEPVHRLLVNSGYNDEEIDRILEKVKWGVENDQAIVFDISEHHHVDPWEQGILDSVPAVQNAIKNSISIASLLGTLGGMVVYERDEAYERSEASAVKELTERANG